MVLVKVDGKGAEAGQEDKSAVLHRDLKHKFLQLAKCEGNYLYLTDGRKIFDASGGAAVGCLGWGNRAVVDAVMKQTLEAPYCASISYTTKVQEDLCRELVDSTQGAMARAYIVNSGQSLSRSTI
jgi:adenosylmethionine-8-amino-7-oxononanoate aminotransferase